MFLWLKYKMFMQMHKETQIIVKWSAHKPTESLNASLSGLTQCNIKDKRKCINIIDFSTMQNPSDGSLLEDFQSSIQIRSQFTSKHR